MLKFSKAPFDEDIEKATNENNLTDDWALIMQICDNTINYQDGSKFCLKAIMKRLHHNVPRVVLQTLTLLDACVKNCDRRFLLQVASSEFTSEVKKLLSKMHPSAADKLKELLQKWSLEEFKDDPELCIIPSLYYELKSKGVDFPSGQEKKKTASAAPVCTNPDAVTSQEEENDIMKAIEISLKDTGRYPTPADYGNPSYSSDYSTPKPATEPLKVRAMYDFDAAEDNELTIKSGEIVMIIDNSNSSWWKGSNHRGEGLFPANFVTDDLNYKPEETIVERAPAAEAASDTSFVGEVKIDEEKIESLINWLNDTDPACESPDPEDMLRLEDEVHKMAPLVEEQLQLVDKRLAMLNIVNEKIVSAFDLFHSLSDNSWSTMPPPTMKYCTLPMSQPQVSMAAMPPSTGFPPMQVMPGQPMMFVPGPVPGQQYIPASEPLGKTVNHPPQATQASMLPPNMPEAASSNMPPHTAPAEAAAVPDQTSVASSAGQMPVSYNPNTVGNFYAPAPMPFQYQYPAAPHSMPPQGFVSPPTSASNAMNVPYAMQASMGPYVSFPYYYMNSLPSAHGGIPATPLNSTQDGVKETSTSSTTEQNATMSTATYPSYSNDLQSATPNTIDQSMSQTIHSNLNAHMEPIQVSK